MASTPVDVVSVAAANPQVPLAADLADFLRRARLMHAAFGHHANELAERVNASSLDAKDDELMLHHLWLDAVDALFEDMRDIVKRVSSMNELRILTEMTARGSTAFGAFGKTLSMRAYLEAYPPAKKTAEWPALLDWLRANAPEAIHDAQPDVSFSALQKVVNDRAEQGKEAPPHVTLNPKMKVKIT